jgi:hypothetical protein
MAVAPVASFNCSIDPLDDKVGRHPEDVNDAVTAGIEKPEQQSPWGESLHPHQPGHRW